MKKIIVLLLTLAVIVACEDKVELIGQWDDNILLSQKSASFSAEGDSVVITTGGDWWWVNSISLDGSYAPMDSAQYAALTSTTFRMERDDYVVERRDKNTLFIMMPANTKGQDRLLTVTLEAGDYFDYVNILQSSEE